MTQFCHLLVACTCILFVSPARAHDSVHEIMSDNTTRTISPQAYINHPFETANTKNSSRRLLSAKWEPLRIHVDTSDLDRQNFSIDATKLLHRITSSALPEAVKILTKHLHVIRVKGNLIISPSCLCYDMIDHLNRYAWHREENVSRCESNTQRCRQALKGRSNCHNKRYPEAHMNEGIPNTDFVLYLTAEDNTDKDKPHALAWGDNCQADQHSRPVAANVHIFMKLLTSYMNQGTLSTNYLVSILAHEISHTLGWSMKHFPRFRDEFGNIRANVITRTYKRSLGKNITILSTPAVTKRVREHFGCNKLTGMELEDTYPGSKDNHPEKRIFPESYMSSSCLLKSNYIIDAMALSVFQDSGWYQVQHLDHAGRLSWGRGMGCRVATHKCNDYGKKTKGKAEMFCSQPENFCVGHSKQAFGYCDIKNYTHPSDPDFRNFSPLEPWFRYFDDPFVAGSRMYPDYCPRAVERKFSDCTDLNNVGKRGMDGDVSGSKVGADSRCFLSSLAIAASVDQNVAVANCYRRTCKADVLQIHLGKHVVACPKSRKPTSVAVEGYLGHIVCPPYAGLEDARCRPTCSNNDPECLGIKGSVVDGVAPSKPQTMNEKEFENNRLSSHDKPVVVHGHLRG